MVAMKMSIVAILVTGCCEKNQWLPWKDTVCCGKLMVAMASNLVLNKSMIALECQWFLCESLVAMCVIGFYGKSVVALDSLWFLWKVYSRYAKSLVAMESHRLAWKDTSCFYLNKLEVVLC
jgi:hypothetical protein